MIIFNYLWLSLSLLPRFSYSSFIIFDYLWLSSIISDFLYLYLPWFYFHFFLSLAAHMWGKRKRGRPRKKDCDILQASLERREQRAALRSVSSVPRSVGNNANSAIHTGNPYFGHSPLGSYCLGLLFYVIYLYLY